MKVSALQLFLRSLRPAVTAADPDSSLPADLEAVSAGLEPFAPLDFGQLTALLRQARQYRDEGVIKVPSPANLGAGKLDQPLRRTVSLVDQLAATESSDPQRITAEREAVRQELERALAEFLKPLAIGVTLKADQKGFQTALSRAKARALAARMRAALQGVTDEASLATPERQQTLRAIFDPLALADLKAVAAELGVRQSKTKAALESAIVERLTGIKPAAKKAARASRRPPVDQAAVERQAVKLKGLVEKSFDPDGLSPAELEAAIRDLEPRSVAELQAIAKEVGLEKVGSKKESILKQIREKLQEAERARESIQV